MGLKIPVLTSRELAARWGYNVGTLANQRFEGRGPKYQLIGRTVIYHLAEVERYERKHPEILQHVGGRR